MILPRWGGAAVYLGSALGAALDGLLLTATSTTTLPLVAGALAVVALLLNQLTAGARARPTLRA